MKRNVLIGAGLILVMAGAVFFYDGCGGGADDGARPRHVLLITLDTTRADFMGYAGLDAGGRSPTPALDALAKEGRGYTVAYAAVPLTLPSHATILTGLEPPSHGIRENDGFVLPPRDRRGFPLLTELLKDQGFDTAAFISAQVLYRGYGLAAGFDLYDDVEPRAAGGHHHFDERDADETTERALTWLAGRSDGKSTFLWVHYFDPHAPYLARDGEAARVAAAVERATGSRTRGRYAGEITHVDRNIARLLDAYREGGLWDDTMCVVVGDHGEGLGDHGEASHGYLVHDATMRVPLIVRPAASGFVPDDRIARTSDVMPTVLDALGLDVPDCDGVSLLRDEAPDVAYGESVYNFRQFEWAALRTWRHDNLKLVDAGGDRRKLYDMDADPGELRDIAAARPDDVARLHRELIAFLREQAKRTPPDARVKGLGELRGVAYLGGPAGNVPVEPDPELNARLPDPAEQMPVLHRLDDLHRGLDRAASGDEADEAAGLELARQAADRLMALAPTCPVVIYWVARTRMKMAESGLPWSKKQKLELCRQSIAGFDSYLEKRPLDWRALDQVLRVHLAGYDLTRETVWLDELAKRFVSQRSRGLADALAWALRGQELLRRNRLEEARDAFAEAVRLDPRKEAFRRDLKRVEEALRDG